MSSLNYVESANQNLICCICRMPFVDPYTNRTCSHTFCRECIVKSLQHFPQCPVDRSALRLEDIHPADPIVRSLVDELHVKCSNDAAGCTYVCQRQLLGAHLKNCQYAEIACPGKCDETILRKDEHRHICGHTSVKCKDCEESMNHSDLEVHHSKCSKKLFQCKDCEAELPCSIRAPHSDSCPATRIKCAQAPNGCSWEGRRQDLPSHTVTCAYEAIKGFFAIHESQRTALSDENTILKHKVEMLESQLRAAEFDLQCAQGALGPWYTNSRSRVYNFSLPSSQLPTQVQPSAASSSRVNISPLEQPSMTQDTPAHSPTVEPDGDVFAPFFPEDSRLHHSASERPDFPATRSHRSSSSFSQSQGWENAAYPPAAARSQQSVVAPLNLNTTLEGTLEGLRESTVALSISLDSLGRRSDIALTNETLRLNEEVMSLRATLHGLRMQLHSIMMGQNAQVTGRGPVFDPVFMQGDTPWLAPNPNRVHAMPSTSPNSVTKL